ncbi:MAG: hypothetical protein SFV15_24860 [Polyangiaceae bacterium]|nr:hypothetical protein [Polyangiaceae bacterium]
MPSSTPTLDLGGAVTDISIDPTQTCNPCTHFAGGPVFEDNLGPDIAKNFPSASGASGPCILEPQAGTLLPANWLRPRFHFEGGTAPYRISLSTPRETGTLDIYTADTIALLPKPVWDGLRANVFEPVTVTVTDATGKSSTSDFTIAPIAAGGSLVFWASTTNRPGIDPATGRYTTTLYGFNVGDEAVIQTLSPPDVQQVTYGQNGGLKSPDSGAPEGKVRCVGCHTSTPDGNAVAIVDHWPWNLAIADINTAIGKTPDYVTPLGTLMLNLPWQGIATFSRDDWTMRNRRILVTSMGPRKMLMPGYTPDANNVLGETFIPQNSNKGPDELVWMDLSAPGNVKLNANGSASEEAARTLASGKGTAWGTLARTGDPRGAITPEFSHAGDRIVYTSTDSILDGHVGGGGVEGTPNPTVVDLYTVPYANGAGGVATPLPGASLPNVAEYYPDYSADDRWVAFNRVPSMTGYMFYRPDGEIHIVPAAGGTAIRLAANDPPACSVQDPKGPLNSWPKWSPAVRAANGKKYYFLIFSSARNSPFVLNVQGEADKRASRLYMAPVVENADGSVQTFPAVYLWNQEFLVNKSGADAQVFELRSSNLTPAWDEFYVPPVTVIIR